MKKLFLLFLLVPLLCSCSYSKKIKSQFALPFSYKVESEEIGFVLNCKQDSQEFLFYYPPILDGLAVEKDNDGCKAFYKGLQRKVFPESAGKAIFAAEILQKLYSEPLKRTNEKNIYAVTIENAEVLVYYNTDKSSVYAISVKEDGESLYYSLSAAV